MAAAANNGLHALVVDDEPLARQEMRYLLGRMEQVATCEEAPTAIDALARLQASPVDVVFLDIRMPGLSGLQAMPVIQALPEPPAVVFVTAYEGHALEAFEVAAVDYLLKPVSEARLRRSLDRIVQRRAPDRESVAAPMVIPAEQDGRTFIIRPEELIFAGADGHVTTLHTPNGVFRCRLTMAELERRLEPAGFLRVHRGFLANLGRIREVNPYFVGTYLLKMDDSARSEVPVSRQAARRLREALGL